MRQESLRANAGTIKLRTYVPEPTPRRFHASNAFVRGIRGPVGSGKSVACCMEVLSRAFEQAPHNGVRKTRWCFVRNTFGELLTTTLKTWQEWVPPELCPVSLSAPIIGRMIQKLSDGTTVDLEIVFLSLDKDDDVKKLKSLELTGAWINEASEISPKVVFDTVTSRVGRYPGEGPMTWSGVILDSNPPSDDHWWFQLAEVEKPKDYEFFSQPPAMLPAAKKNPDDPTIWVPNDGSFGVPAAENLQNLKLGFKYYERMVGGKDAEWLKVYILGQYGTVMSGKPVFPEYKDVIHVAKAPLVPFGGLPVVIGYDFGLNPSAVFAQLTPKGQLVVLGEITSDNMGIKRFASELLRPYVLRNFAGMRLVGVGDPAGESRAQTDEVTCYEILAEEGFPAEPSITNDFIPRREAVSFFLTRLDGFLLDPGCTVLRKGFLGRYEYRKLKASGSARFTEAPAKNAYSHCQDALQYAAMFIRGAGAGGPGTSRVGRPTARSVRVASLAAWS